MSSKYIFFKFYKFIHWVHEWEKRLSGSWKEIHLLVYNLKVWLEKGHGQIDSSLTQVMSTYGAFNAYQLYMRLM